eukprot:3141288-Prymnesium_polylepis.1
MRTALTCATSVYPGTFLHVASGQVLNVLGATRAIFARYADKVCNRSPHHSLVIVGRNACRTSASASRVSYSRKRSGTSAALQECVERVAFVDR